MFRLNNGIYGQRQGGTNQMVRVKVPVRLDDARAARDDGLHRRPLQPRLGPHHDPSEHPVPLRPARRHPRRDGASRLGRADQPRGVRRHRAQHPGLPPRRRLPARGARHHAVGRGGVPALRAQPARPAPAAQVQDQLLRLLHRLRSGDVQRRRRRSPSRARCPNGEVERGFRVYIAGGLGANPHPALALEEFTSREDLLPTIEAILRVFDQAGNRDNKLRARLKWLVDTLGFDEVQRRDPQDPPPAAGVVVVAGRHPARGRRASATRRRASPPTVR